MQVQDDKPYDDINITPMLDLAYVLLVIFILMCTAAVQGLKADLPAGSEATKSLAEKKAKGITINGAGQVSSIRRPSR
jgi:biopolymer transport protein ExbD